MTLTFILIFLFSFLQYYLFLIANVRKIPNMTFTRFTHVGNIAYFVHYGSSTLQLNVVGLPCRTLPSAAAEFLPTCLGSSTLIRTLWDVEL
jgi:hypothetical protein